jgi:hypothetical protein
MLSKTQQEILDTIKSNLEKLNQAELPQGGLINIGAIVNKFEDAETRSSEIELNNKAFSKIRSELLLQSIDILNADLKHLGLKARPQYPNHIEKSPAIIIDDVQGRTCWNKPLQIEITVGYTTETVGSRNIKVAKEIYFIFRDNKFNSLKELVDYNHNDIASFNKYLFNYYSEINNKVLVN